MKIKRDLVRMWLLFTAMLPATVQAQFVFVTNSGAISITGYTGLGGVLTIPDTINGLPVANIATNAFSDCSGLNCVIIPSSVTSIGSHAFSGCTNLISVFLGGNAPSADSTVFTDDNDAFAYYLPGTTGWGPTFAGIQTVLPPYNYSVNYGTITLTSYAGSDTTVTIPGMIGGLPVISIAASAFQNRALTSVTIPDSVTNIGSAAFSVCTNLACATIGDGLTSIPPLAFFHCSSLANVTIGKDVISINDSAFESCGLTSVTVPSGVTTIGNHAFSACLSLTNVAIGNGVTSIGTEAFSGCYGLRGVCFPGNVYTGYLGPDVFSVDNPTIYYLPGTTGWGKTFDGLPTALLILPVPYNYTTNNGAITITGYTGSGGAVTIPGKIYVSGATNFLPVSSIGADAFSGCSSLVGVVLPNSVTNLGSHAFSGCTNLLGVFFGSNAPSADSTVFLGDSNALAYSYYFPRPTGQGSTLVGIPTGLLPYTYTINNGAINITGYTGSGGAVTIPGTVGGLPITSIGSEAFYQCTNLNSVTIPDGVTNIGHGAFAFCSNLASVTMPNSVASIGICAFWNCTSLTGVTLSTNLTEIGASDFDSCTSLASAAIPNGILIIRGSAFQNCPGLTDVAVPASVASIGQSAFDSCGSLLAIAVDPQNFYLGSLDGVLVNKSQNAIILCPGGRSGSYTIPSSITNVGNSAFASCRSITNVTFPNSVTSIGDWAVDSCSNLTNVTISTSVINIGCYAFESCSSLTSVSIPDNVTTIGYHAFDGCTGLTDATIGSGLTGFGSRVGFNTFSDCPNLASIYLTGIAPYFAWNPTNQIATPAAYYLPWANPTSISNLPAALWLPRVRTGDAGFGVQTNQFGFTINWAGGETVVVEACADLANPVWTPLSTNTIAGTLGNGSVYFSDPQRTNFPNRFYRIRGLDASPQ